MPVETHRTNSPIYPFLYIIQDVPVAHTSNRTNITTVFHQRPYGRFRKVKRNLSGKKLHRRNHLSKPLGGNLNNRDNARSTTELRKKGDFWKVFKERLVYFQINRTTIIPRVKWSTHSLKVTSCPNLGPFRTQLYQIK